MALILRIEAVGLEAGDYFPMQTQAVLAAMLAVQQQPLVIPDVVLPPPPEPFLTPTLVLS